jgi:hypothetical protein
VYVRIELDRSKERENDGPPCELGNYACLAHIESERRSNRGDPTGVSEVGSEGNVQVDTAKSTDMDKRMDIDENLGRPSVTLSGLIRRVEPRLKLVSD